MSDVGSVTERWLPEFKAGEADAESALWARFFQRIVVYTRSVMRKGHVRSRVVDAEDIGLSVFSRLCHLRKKSSSPLDEIFTGEDLWYFVVLLISGKVIDERRRQLRKRRGGGSEKGESGFLTNRDGDERRGFELVVGEQAPIEEFVANAEQREQFLDVLVNEQLKKTARLHLDGWNKSEIGKQLHVQRQTVAKRLSKIFRIWRIAYLLETSNLRELDIEVEVNQLLSRLPDGTMRQVAATHLQGLTIPQISKELSLDEDLVEMELDFALSTWSEEQIND